MNVDNLFKNLTSKILDKINTGDIPTDGVLFYLLRQLGLKRVVQGLILPILN